MLCLLWESLRAGSNSTLLPAFALPNSERRRQAAFERHCRKKAALAEVKRRRFGWRPPKRDSHKRVHEGLFKFTTADENSGGPRFVGTRSRRSATLHRNSHFHKRIIAPAGCCNMPFHESRRPGGALVHFGRTRNRSGSCPQRE